MTGGPHSTRTTCPYCGVGCGVKAMPDGDGGAAIAGDEAHPANFGRLCSKGSALGETLSLEGRLLHPMMRGDDGVLGRVSWDAALDRVAEGFFRAIAEHGPDSVAFYLSGQLLTEDYYAPNKLMKGFIGSANVDTNSRLCMASSVAGHRRAFGADIVPGAYEDLDEADLLVLVGSNAAWCHPILYQRMQTARERGALIVNVDVRRTATSEGADIDLTIAPGSDAALFSGLLVHLADHGLIDRAFVDERTSGFEAALAQARLIAPNIAAVAAATACAPETIAHVFDLWARSARVVTLYSQGVNQSAQGTDKVNAILNCHLATGRIGLPGAGPFSLTGQPNAMGGREVGGLANQLAAHMAFDTASIDRVRRFWNAPAMATREGLKAVDLFDAVADGRIKALWVMGTNPAVSMPRADAVRAALQRLDLLVVSDNLIATDTTQSGAHVLLPAAAWGEKDGTVTNSERRISRQRAFLPLPGEVRPDWWAVAQVARRLGHGEAFAWRGPADIFREHAALSAFENDGTRDFDIGGLAAIDDAAYDALEPVQWPVRSGQPGGTARLFGDGGRFFHADGKARFVPVAAPALAAATDAAFPLILVTGRIRDQWHTMTRTGKSARLGSHLPEPFLDVHPIDALRLGLSERGFARVESAHGGATLRVRITAQQEPGLVFAPIHWSGQTSVGGRIGAAVQGFADPVSGQPEMKATPVAVHPVSFVTQGFALTRALPRLERCGFLAHATVKGGTLTTFASDASHDALLAMLAPLFGGAAPTMDYSDPARGLRRLAWLDGERIEALLFLGPGGTAPDWNAAAAAFATGEIAPAARALLLSGKPVDGIADSGPTICACFGIGRGAIEAAIAGGCGTVAAIGAALKAGTNCGSCVPELKKLIAQAGGAAEGTPARVAADAA